MRNPDRVFLDVMRYADGIIPTPESFETQKDLQRYIEDVDRQAAEQTGKGRRISARALELMTNSRVAAQRLFTTKQRKAVNVELSRSKRARLVDESRTAKSPNLLDINQKNFLRWKKNPQKFDLKGVDTKTHEFIKTFVKTKSQRYKNEGSRVINVRDVTVFAVRRSKVGVLFAQDVVTGRRVGKRVFSRFGTLKELRR